MQTILGANGQIAMELAQEPQRKVPGDLRLVSCTPRKVHAPTAWCLPTSSMRGRPQRRSKATASSTSPPGCRRTRNFGERGFP